MARVCVTLLLLGGLLWSSADRIAAADRTYTDPLGRFTFTEPEADRVFMVRHADFASVTFALPRTQASEATSVGVLATSISMSCDTPETKVLRGFATALKKDPTLHPGPDGVHTTRLGGKVGLAYDVFYSVGGIRYHYRNVAVYLGDTFFGIAGFAPEPFFDNVLSAIHLIVDSFTFRTDAPATLQTPCPAIIQRLGDG